MYIYTYTFVLFLILSSIMFYPTRDLIKFPVLYSKTSFLIHSKCNSLHLHNPNFLSITLLLPFPRGNHRSVLYVCKCVSVL